MKIAIIGAGIAGIASAVRLAARGHEIHVFEANAYPGGKLSEFVQDGCRFDAGPSLFTMPQYVDELFSIAGEDPREYFTYERLPVVCHYFWEDGVRIRAFADQQQFDKELYQKLGLEYGRLDVLLADSRRKYELTGRIFLEKSLHKARTWLSWKVLKAMIQIPRFDLFTNMNAVNKRLGGHPKLVQLFNRYATYNGSDPYRAPGLLTIIPHFEYGFGAYYPKGGMYQITQKLFELAKRKGAQFHFNTSVEEIVVSKGQAKGIRINNQFLPFDKVVCNMDVFHAYRKLLPHQPAPKRTLSLEKSTSALIFYWGISRQFTELDLHNIFFSEDYRAEFKYLANGEIYHDPTVYINITQKYTPEDAPAGHENWFTMINVPYNRGQNWDKLIVEAKSNILNKISRILGVDISQFITSESILDPRTIESRTASHLGALYGTSSNNRMAAFMRHPNFSAKISNLFFCGGSVHPGGGIPLALLSAKITDELMNP